MRLRQFNTRRAIDLLDSASPIMLAGGWPIIALLIGIVPPIVGYALGSQLHQTITGFLLSVMFLPYVLRDLSGRSLLLVAIVVGSHSGIVILISLHDPVGAAAVLSGSRAYWEQTRIWLQTGSDPEYQLIVWLPKHLLLFGEIAAGAGLTLGVAVFVEGIMQVDQMNYYVGRMMAQSDHKLLILLFGWHPWSILRGVACSILVFECVSWTIEHMTHVSVRVRRRRGLRLVSFVPFAVADALAKFSLTPIVRDQLYGSLWADFQ